MPAESEEYTKQGESLSSMNGMKQEPSKQNMEKLLATKELKEYIAGRSDAAGLLQLLFHASCVCACACAIRYSVQSGSWLLFVLGELCLGLVASFYFNLLSTDSEHPVVNATVSS